MRKKHKETLTDLRRKKRRGIKLTMKERFRLLASKASKRYHMTGWSSYEESFRKAFEELGFQKDVSWIHNYPLFNPLTKRFYEIDFLFYASYSPREVLNSLCGICSRGGEFCLLKKITKRICETTTEKIERDVSNMPKRDINLRNRSGMGKIIKNTKNVKENSIENILLDSLIHSGENGEIEFSRRKRKDLECHREKGLFDLENFLLKKKEENVNYVISQMREPLTSTIKKDQIMKTEVGMPFINICGNLIECSSCVLTAIESFILSRAKAIEISPKLYHKKLGNVEEKDRRKKQLLKKLGFKYIAFGTEVKLDSKTRRIKKSDKKMMKRLIFS